MNFSKSLISISIFLVLGSLHAQEGQDLYRILGTQPGGNMGHLVGGGEFSVVPDGLPDLVAVENSRILITEYPGLNSWLEIISFTYTNRLSTMDVDLDGRPDICLERISNYATEILHGPIGNRTTTVIPLLSSYSGGHFLGNVTGSPHPEVFISDDYRNNDGCRFWNFDPISPGFTPWSRNGQDAVSLGDATGDGYEEFALLAADSVQLWHGVLHCRSLLLGKWTQCSKER